MLAVIILTHNESRHLARCIAAIKNIASDIIVVDSYSTDNTLNIAIEAGARVFQHEFENYASQFAWGMANAGIVAPWIMRLDADEIIEEALQIEIRRKLPQLGEEIVGVNLKRRHYFWGRWIKHGGRYPLVLLRIWRNGKGKIENRWMDEHIVVWGGRTVDFSEPFSDQNLNDLSFFIEKHNKYATREAVDVLNNRYKLFDADTLSSRNQSSKQANAKRWVKENIYNRLPFGMGPSLYFLYRFFIQLGFMDGKAGWVYHFMQGFWYRALVDAKVIELENGMTGCKDSVERVSKLVELTGYRLR